MLLIYTGCRLSKILTLRWDYVTSHHLELQGSKTGRRRIPLSRMDSTTQITVRPRATDIIGAVAYTGMSRATLYAEMKKGALKFVKIGGATRLEYNELDRWFDEKSKEVAA